MRQESVFQNTTLDLLKMPHTYQKKLQNNQNQNIYPCERTKGGLQQLCEEVQIFSLPEKNIWIIYMFKELKETNMSRGLKCEMRSHQIAKSVKSQNQWGWRDGSEVKSTRCSSEDSSSTSWLTIVCNTSPRGSDAAFWPLQTPGTHVAHRHTYKQNTHAHEVKMES